MINNGFIFIMNGFNNDNIIFHIAQENIENPLTISSKINRSNTYTNVQEELEIENVIKDKNISIYFCFLIIKLDITNITFDISVVFRDINMFQIIDIIFISSIIVFIVSILIIDYKFIYCLKYFNVNKILHIKLTFNFKNKQILIMYSFYDIIFC